MRIYHKSIIKKPFAPRKKKKKLVNEFSNNSFIMILIVYATVKCRKGQLEVFILPENTNIKFII